MKFDEYKVEEDALTIATLNVLHPAPN